MKNSRVVRTPKPHEKRFEIQTGRKAETPEERRKRLREIRSRG